MSLKKKFALVVLIVILSLTWFVFFSPFLAKKMGKKSYSEHSGDMKYHIDFFQVAPFYFGDWNMRAPGFIKLYDEKEQLLIESDIFDLQDNGPVSWADFSDKQPGISVGLSIFIPVLERPLKPIYYERLRAD